MLFGILLIKRYYNFICHLSILGLLSNRPRWTVLYRKACPFLKCYSGKGLWKESPPLSNMAMLVQGLFLKRFSREGLSSADKALENHTRWSPPPTSCGGNNFLYSLQQCSRHVSLLHAARAAVLSCPAVCTIYCRWYKKISLELEEKKERTCRKKRAFS